MKIAKSIIAVLISVLFVFAAVTPAFAGDDDKVIKEVQLTISKPEVGAAPDTVIVSAEPEKYSASLRYWIKRTYPDEKVEKFESDFEYAMVFTVTPLNGYTFETVQMNENDYKESPTVVYVNGELARCVSYESETQLQRSFVVNFEEDIQDGDMNFFEKIISAIKDFFAGIVNFFKNLFYSTELIQRRHFMRAPLIVEHEI